MKKRSVVAENNTYDTLLSVVIGSYNRLPYLKGTIDSIRAEMNTASKKSPVEIIVVDGGSTDGTSKWLLEQKDIITITQYNRGEWRGKQIERRSWGYFMNLGFKSARGKYVCMLSDDCLVVPGALRNGIKEFERLLKAKKPVGALAFYWRNWPEQPDYMVGLTFGKKLFVNHGLYLREGMEAVNYCDEDNFYFYHADGDLGLRMAEAGYECYSSPNSYIEHYSDANTKVRASNMARQKKDWATYTQRWKHLGSFEGGWENKTFIDTTNTALKYWGRQHTLNRIKGRFIK